MGSGAYATVEHCRLANWRDPSQHGARSSGIATALEGYSPSPGADDSAYPRHHRVGSSGGLAGGSPSSRSDGKPPSGSRRAYRSMRSFGSSGSGTSLGKVFGGGDGGGGVCGGGARNSSRPPALLDVAVKHLRPSLFDCPTDLEDFVREAVLLAGLQHRYTSLRHTNSYFFPAN